MVEQPSKASRLSRVILVCSLALNLAVAGIVIGALVTGRAGDGPPRSFDLGVSAVARALSPQERRDVGRSLREARIMRDVDLRGRIDEMVATLKADPFEPEAFQALMQAQAAQMAVVQGKAQDAFLEAITQMTPERRAAFADRLVEEMAKERPRRATRGSGG